RQVERQPDLLGADLVHAQCRAEHARAGVRHAERVQQPLQHAVLATALVAVEDVEDAVDRAGANRIDQRRDAVDRHRVDAASLQRLQHVATGIQRHLALGAGAAHQYRDTAEHGGIREPQRGEGGAHAASPSIAVKPWVATYWAAWPMSPAPIISSRSPSSSTSPSNCGSSRALPTTTGSTRPRVRIARASARA